jgi:hypothetical protein
MLALWECFTNIHVGDLFSEDGKRYPSRQKIWNVPEHQRERAWDKHAIEDYYRDLIGFYNEGGGQMAGTIQIYNYKNDQNAIYVNDGLQRTFFSLKYIYENLRREKRFKKMFANDRSSDFRDMMQEIKIEVQRVEYENIEDAIEGFVGANKGTLTTPFELGKTIFCRELPDFSSFWGPRLNQVHEAIEKGVSDVGCKRGKNPKRTKSHKSKRDNLNIFRKYISGDKTTKSFRVAEPIYQGKKSLGVEIQLVEILKTLEHDEFEKKLERFKTMVVNATAFYAQTFEEVVGKRMVPAEVNFRWWLIAKIHMTNMTVPLVKIKDFTEKFLKNNSGRSAFFYKDENGKQNNTNCAMSNISKISHLSNIIGFDLDDAIPGARPKSPYVRSGFHASHESSFSENGDNPVRLENALENLSRNNKDMSEEEKARLPLFALD